MFSQLVTLLADQLSTKEMRRFWGFFPIFFPVHLSICLDDAENHRENIFSMRRIFHGVSHGFFQYQNFGGLEGPILHATRHLAGSHQFTVIFWDVGSYCFAANYPLVI